MKFQKILLGAALVVLSAACQQIENPADNSEAKDVKLVPVTFQAKTLDTKTTLDGLSIVWEEGDQINVLDNSEYCEMYESFTSTGAGATTGFTGEIDDEATTFYAVYPYDAKTQESWAIDEECAMFSTELPYYQIPRLNGLPKGANIAVAKADNNKSFTFHNLCGVIKFTLTRDDISSIEIVPNKSGEGAISMSGNANITLNLDGSVSEIEHTDPNARNIYISLEDHDPFAPGTYYVCAYPGTYPYGITVYFTNLEGAETSISSEADLTLTGGKIRNLGTIDKNISFGGDEEPQTIVINATNSGITSSYSNGEFDVNEITFKYNQWLKSSNSIQAKASTTNSLYNEDAIPGTITKITVVTASGKTARATEIYGGTSEKPTTKIPQPATESTMVYDFSGKSCNYFSLKTPGNACYFESISIEYIPGAVKVLNSVAVSGTPTKTSYYEDETFEPDGLVVTGAYSDGTQSVITEGISWSVTPEDLTLSTTSVNVTATVDGKTSEAYPVNVTVSAIPDKTIADFITTEGGKCYLTGIVGDIKNATYGNFNLTDESGTIYVYGCLTPEGKKGKFSTLDIQKGDKIKVLANEYMYFENTTHEAVDVIFVEEIEIPKVKSVITISTPDNGTITVKNGDATVNSGVEIEEGTVLTLSATPNWNYEFGSWSVTAADNTPVSVSNNKFTMPAQAVSVNAIFTVIPPYLKATASKTTGISAVGETITITVDTNIDSWSASITGDSTFALDKDNKTATTIPVIVSENTDVENGKNATVTITAGDKTVEIQLSQLVKTESGQGGDSTTISKDFSSAGYENGQAIEEVTLDDNITINFSKGENSNAPKYYTTGTAIRCYGGNSFTVSASDATITKITLTFSSGEGANVITTNVGTFNTDSWAGSASSVTFSIGGSTGHRRIKEIEVTYEN